ncbi:MAG: glycosyltransferase family 39 protein, partial [Chthoniobacterales bacterium]
AMVTTPLLISSPLAAGLSRRAMQDTFTALVFVLVLYLFDRCWRRASWANYVAFGAVFAVALLTKETALFLLPLMVCAAVYYMRAMRLAFRWPILLSLAVAAMVYILVETYLAGGISRFIDTYRTYAALQHQLTYPLHYVDGPWFIYLLAFLAVAPLAFVAAIVGLTVPPDDEARHGRILACLYLLTGILVFAQLPIVNVRLVLFLDVFLRIAAALAIIYFARVVTTKWRSGVLVALIGVLVLADAAQFYRVFVRGNVYNPNTFLLLRAEGFYDVE